MMKKILITLLITIPVLFITAFFAALHQALKHEGVMIAGESVWGEEE